MQSGTQYLCGCSVDLFNQIGWTLDGDVYALVWWQLTNRHCGMRPCNTMTVQWRCTVYTSETLDDDRSAAEMTRLQRCVFTTAAFAVVLFTDDTPRHVLRLSVSHNTINMIISVTITIILDAVIILDTISVLHTILLAAVIDWCVHSLQSSTHENISLHSHVNPVSCASETLLLTASFTFWLADSFAKHDMRGLRSVVE